NRAPLLVARVRSDHRQKWWARGYDHVTWIDARGIHAERNTCGCAGVVPAAVIRTAASALAADSARASTRSRVGAASWSCGLVKLSTIWIRSVRSDLLSRAPWSAGRVWS